MLSPPLRYPALVAAVLLIAAGTVQIARALAAAERVRTKVVAPGPMHVGGKSLRLIERPGPDASHVFVDLEIGDRRLPADGPIWFDPMAAKDDYAGRYAGRFVFFEPVAGKTDSVHLIEFDHGGARTDRVRYRLVEVAADGSVGLRTLEQDPAAARAAIADNTLGARPAPPFVVPAPLMLIAGAWLALAARLRSAPAGWPTVLVVWTVVGLMSLVAWAPMLHLGLARALPAPILAFAVASVVAVLAGPRLQAIAAAEDSLRAAATGAVVAVGLLLAFVTVQVASNAFIAPVFRPPGGELSPAGWLMRDYVSPALLLLLTGAPSTILAGAFYGLACRWSRMRMAPQ